MIRSPLAVAAALVLSLPLASHAIVFQFNANLTTTAEVHTLVTPSSATGLATLFYDDKGTMTAADDTYNFSMSVGNLTGVASAYHIHGAATPAQTAGVRVGLDMPPFGSLNMVGLPLLVGGIGVPVATTYTAPPSGPFAGVSFLSMLRGSLAYVNVHTAGNAAGEVRGQLIEVAQIPEPSTYAMLLGGLGIVGFMARRRRAAQA